jgi:hypothetical protein
MQEALKEERVVEKLKELGYDPGGIYVYGQKQPSGLVAALFGIFAYIFSPIKPYILNFTSAGFAMLELNMTLSKFTGMHSFVAVERIEEISFKKGVLQSTLTVKKEGEKKASFKIQNFLAFAGWQKPSVEKLELFLETFKRP